MTPKQTTTVQRFAKYGIPFLSVILFSLVLFSVPAAVWAHVDTTNPNHTHQPGTTGSAACPPGKICNPTRFGTIDALLLAVVTEVVKYGLLLIVFFLVLAGFKFVVAQGNPEKINDAKKMLVWVIVGAFVLLGVFVIREAVCGTIDAISADPNKKACQ